MSDLLNRLKDDLDARKLAEELAALRDVADAAGKVVGFCYTTPDGKLGWRGEVNMKGILNPVSDLRFALDRLNGVRTARKD